MSRKRIGVVGFGPTGLSFLAQFLEGLDAPERFELLIFDPSPHGLGDAYREQAASNLMNTSVEVTSLYEDKPDDFLHWLNENASAWRELFPTKESFSGQELVPRLLFGRYLRARRAQLLERAALLGLPLRLHTVEITDIEGHAENFRLVTAAMEFEVDAVLLFTGCFKRPCFPSLEGKPGFIDSIYEQNLSELVGEEASVLVLGSKLSAIDAILQVASQFPKAKITAASRTGEFQAPNLAIDLRRLQPNRWLNRDAFDAKRKETPSLPVEEVLYGLTQNALRDLGYQWDIQTFLEQKPTERFTSQCGKLDSGPAAYESLILPLAQLLENVWWDLDKAQRASVLKKYFRVIMHYVGAFPSENARRLLALIQSGQLHVADGLKTVEASSDGFTATFEKTPAKTFNVAIDCSGYDNGLTNHTVSRLMKQIVEKNLFELNGCGGFQIDRQYRVVSTDGRQREVFASGFPIKASVPFANWYNRIVQGTHRIACTLKGQGHATI